MKVAKLNNITENFIDSYKYNGGKIELYRCFNFDYIIQKTAKSIKIYTCRRSRKNAKQYKYSLSFEYMQTVLRVANLANR